MNKAIDDNLEPIYLLYDERMLLHRPLEWTEPLFFPKYRDEVDENYPIENPERLRVIYERLCNLSKRIQYDKDEYDQDLNEGYDNGIASGSSNPDHRVVFYELACRMASREEVLLAHDEKYYDRLDRLEFQSDTELIRMSNDEANDMYYCQESFRAARLAAGGLLSCVDAIFEHTTSTPSAEPSHLPVTPNKAVALVRPPGHHACQSKEMGFCFIDSVVVAAKYAIRNKKAKRVVILDWDIHDGNATADATIRDENIFRIDLHRYNPKHPFYPFTGSPKEVGIGKAKGLNLNLCWSQGGMGNAEYAAAFYEVILPLLADYKPDLLIISCGLDAAMGDLIGDCNLTPGFYHAMTRSALEVVGPQTPVLCALEGGYTIDVIPDCMEAVSLAMLNLPFSFHSTQRFLPLLYSSAGGADVSEVVSRSWSSDDALLRSRYIISKYYVRFESRPLALAKSAIQDINTAIRIFHGIKRWRHLPLNRIEVPSATSSAQKRDVESSSRETQAIRPFSRPRIYLWYGTEEHHRKRGFHHYGGGYYYGHSAFYSH